MNYSITQLAQNMLGTILHQSAQNTTINHLLTDSRKILFPQNSVYFAINGARHNGHQYLKDVYEAGVTTFVVEEVTLFNFPKNVNVILVNNSLNALQMLAANHRLQNNYPVIGITGSNGKTVTKEWLFQLLKESFAITRSPKSFNSQIGVPLSVLQMQSTHNLAIIEAGISLPNEMQNLQHIIKPTIGIFTFLGSAHNEGFGSNKEKLHQKLQLFKDCEWLIYCADQPEVVEGIELFKPRHAQLKSIGWSKQNSITATYNFLVEPNQSETKISYNNLSIAIPFTDEASIWNACSCLAFLLASKEKLNLNLPNILPNFKQLQAIEMRLQLKEGINNCVIINDSYSADLNSLQIALDFMQQQSAGYKKTLIISDILQSGLPADKLYQLLAQLVKQYQINKIIGIGTEIKNHDFLFAQNAVFYNSTNSFIQDFHQLDFTNQVILLKGSRSFSFEKINLLLERKVHQTVFEINLNALVQNLNFYKSLLKPNVKLMAMVKAFSYGAGSYEIAKVLEFNRVDYLTVAYADEGVTLRKAGIKTPIMVMNPETSSFNAILKHNLEPEIYNFSILKQLITAANGLEVGMHIEFDSGMKRLGFSQNDCQNLVKVLRQNKNLQVKSVFTHLAASDETEHDAFTNLQISNFDKLTNDFCSHFNYPIVKHCLNSSGITRFKNAQFNMVRLGIGLYGIDPSHEIQNQLQHIGTLKTVISQIRIIEPNESIGYGRKGNVSKTSKIAITAIGYADGLNRLLSNGNGQMLVNGKIAPIIGNICMDMTMVDVTDIDCKEGDEVIVFGKDLNVIQMAKRLNTIPYEVLTSISQRVKRVYFYE